MSELKDYVMKLYRAVKHVDKDAAEAIRKNYRLANHKPILNYDFNKITPSKILFVGFDWRRLGRYDWDTIYHKLKIAESEQKNQTPIRCEGAARGATVRPASTYVIMLADAIDAFMPGKEEHSSWIRNNAARVFDFDALDRIKDENLKPSVILDEAFNWRAYSIDEAGHDLSWILVHGYLARCETMAANGTDGLSKPKPSEDLVTKDTVSIDQRQDPTELIKKSGDLERYKAALKNSLEMIRRDSVREMLKPEHATQKPEPPHWTSRMAAMDAKLNPFLIGAK